MRDYRGFGLVFLSLVVFGAFVLILHFLYSK
jgi:hypothetical protein